MTQARRPGRPPRSSVPATDRLEMRITPAEREAWERAAGDLSLSEWLRGLANRAAKRSVK